MPIFPGSHLTPADEKKIFLPPGTELVAKSFRVSKYRRVQAALLSSIRLPVISAPYLVSLQTTPLLSTDKLHKTLEYSYLFCLSLGLFINLVSRRSKRSPLQSSWLLTELSFGLSNHWKYSWSWSVNCARDLISAWHEADCQGSDIQSIISLEIVITSLFLGKYWPRISLMLFSSGSTDDTIRFIYCYFLQILQ